MPTSTAWPPAPLDDQGRLLQKLLGDAAAEDRPLFVPPGRYLVANVTLPARTRLVGIAGATEFAVRRRRARCSPRDNAESDRARAA